MCTLRFCTFYAVIVSCLTSCAALCIEDENVMNCSEIESVSELIGSHKTTYPNVTYLSIQNSNITFDKNLAQYFPSMKEVDLTGSEVNCTKYALWLLEWSELIKPKNVMCFAPASERQHQALNILSLLSYVELNCPEKCSCSFAHVKSEQNNSQTGTDTATVNCSNLGLTALPRVLPNVTKIILDVSNNKIEDVSELASNNLYKHVRELNLTKNHVKSISKLEASSWLSNVMVFNLTWNHLRELPIQVFNNTSNLTDGEGHRFFLANNPWRCNCSIVVDFKKFVIKTMAKSKMIKDADEVTCGSGENQLIGKRIMKIDLDKLCVADNVASMLMALDGLNAFLASITALTVGKLLYDFYAYRKTGQLPWLATKLP